MKQIFNNLIVNSNIIGSIFSGVMVAILVPTINYIWKSIKKILSRMSAIGNVNWKERHIISGIIFSEVSERTILKRRDIIKKYLYDMLMIIMIPIVLLGMLYTAEVFAEIRMNQVEDYVQYGAVGGMLCGCVCMTSILGKRLKNNGARGLLLVLVEMLLCSFGFSMLAELKCLIVFIQGVAYIFINSISLYVRKYIFVTRYKDWFTKICDFVRYGILVIIMNYQMLYSNEVWGKIFDLWIGITIIEYLYGWRRVREGARIVVYLVGGEILGCDRVLELKDGRVMCVEANDETHIVEKNHIAYMMWQRVEMCTGKDKKRQKLRCEFVGGLQIFYNKYWVDKNKWFHFVLRQNGVRKEYLCLATHVQKYGIC